MIINILVIYTFCDSLIELQILVAFNNIIIIINVDAVVVIVIIITCLGFTALLFFYP